MKRLKFLAGKIFLKDQARTYENMLKVLDKEIKKRVDSENRALSRGAWNPESREKRGEAASKCGRGFETLPVLRNREIFGKNPKPKGRGY